MLGTYIVLLAVHALTVIYADVQCYCYNHESCNATSTTCMGEQCYAKVQIDREKRTTETEQLINSTVWQKLSKRPLDIHLNPRHRHMVQLPLHTINDLKHGFWRFYGDFSTLLAWHFLGTISESKFVALVLRKLAWCNLGVKHMIYCDVCDKIRYKLSVMKEVR